MRVFYDTEFLEDGRTIELISIGMVAEDGRELYAVAQEIEAEPIYSRICSHDWLMRNVIPHLPMASRADHLPKVAPPSSQSPGRFGLDLTDNRIMPRRMIRNAVRDFLVGYAAQSEERGEELELWASYGAYDHVVLAQLFGPMVKLPASIPMFTHDLQQLAAGRPVPAQTGAEHDALADARWTRDAYAALNNGESA